MNSHEQPQSQTSISYSKSTIQTILSGNFTPHFREWSRLWIATRYIEDRVIPNLYHVINIYKESTGKLPTNPNGIEM